MAVTLENTLMIGFDSLTPEQRDIASAIRRALTQAGVEFHEAIGGAEPVLTIKPVLAPALKLEASFHVGGDNFVMIANGVDLRLAVQDARLDEKAWARMCIDTVEALLAHDLRIRVRRTLFGGRTGAVWVPLNGGGWNGELLAYLGLAREEVFPWTRKPTGGA